MPHEIRADRRKSEVKMITNNENIVEIKMYPTARCFCPLGKAWYTNNFTATVKTGSGYPDYLDVQQYITDHIEGHSLTIEAACNELRTYLDSMEGVMDCEVKSEVCDAAHFAVEVTSYGK